MPFQNKTPEQINISRHQLAFLGALTLIFSYAEMLLPRILPFFRFGLANIIILLSLKLKFFTFLKLILLKTVATCLMSGTLFTPFAFISAAQSISSGLLMFLLFRLPGKNQLLSIFGISLCGSALSAYIQIYGASLYLGSGTFNLLGPMLAFSLISGIVTAFFSLKINIPGGGSLPLASKAQSFSATPSSGRTRNAPLIISAVLIICFAAYVFFINSLTVLGGAFALSLFLQISAGRKILVLPHVFLWTFVLITTIFTPEGKVIYSLWNLSITEGALLSGIEKALKLSTVSALSQSAAGIKPSGTSLIALTLSYYRFLSDKFSSAKGNIFVKIKSTLADI